MIKKLSIALVAILTLGSCAREFNKVYRTTDTDFKYEYAKECYVQGKYSNAVTLLQDLVTIQKGTDNGQECLFMLAMAEYQLKDCLLYTSPSPRDGLLSRMPSSA